MSEPGAEGPGGSGGEGDDCYDDFVAGERAEGVEFFFEKMFCCGELEFVEGEVETSEDKVGKGERYKN